MGTRYPSTDSEVVESEYDNAVIGDTVNYRTAAKAIIQHIEEGRPLLVERLAMELAQICLESDEKIEAVELTVEKPGAVRFAASVGLTIFRKRDDLSLRQSE